MLLLLPLRFSSCWVRSCITMSKESAVVCKFERTRNQPYYSNCTYCLPGKSSLAAVCRVKPCQLSSLRTFRRMMTIKPSPLTMNTACSWALCFVAKFLLADWSTVSSGSYEIFTDCFSNCELFPFLGAEACVITVKDAWSCLDLALLGVDLVECVH